MKREIEFTITELNLAFLSLKKGVEQAKDELEKDGVIQRFEFTYELLCKTLKVVLSSRDIMVNPPVDCLKAAFRTKLINDEELFLCMRGDRNSSSHIYDQSLSEEIFIRIKTQYVTAIENVIENLKITFKN